MSSGTPQDPGTNVPQTPVGLSTEETAAKAHDLGYQYERQFHGCCQCSLAAIQDSLGMADDGVFKAASGLSGGLGLSGQGTCGALVGAVLALGQLCGRGREGFHDPEGKRQVSYRYGRLVQERFQEKYGSTICRDIQKALHGRHFNMLDEQDWQEFMRLGGHSHTCPKVVARAARWAVELILANQEELHLPAKDEAKQASGANG